MVLRPEDSRGALRAHVEMRVRLLRGLSLMRQWLILDVCLAGRPPTEQDRDAVDKSFEASCFKTYWVGRLIIDQIRWTEIE